MASPISYNISNETPMDLAIGWINLSFYGSRSPFSSGKLILDHLNGHLDFGTLTALMGPSGCGKSTLLKCINGRSVSGISGDTQIFISKKRPVRTCFIVQDQKEHLLFGLTGKESMLYASKLKNNNASMNGAIFDVNHRKNIKKLMADLMITETTQTAVENCSGGEQKRLVIAMELTSVKKPSVLCIDEPTTGLDSNAAEVVMKCLKEVAVKHKIAIVTSIHQPNADILLMFNKILVLIKGGKTIFSGPPANLQKSLARCGIICQSWQVPIEMMISLATRGMKDSRVRLLVQESNSETKNLHDLCHKQGTLTQGVEIKVKSFSLNDFSYLFLRCFVCTFRSQWKIMVLQYVANVAFAAFLSQLYNEDVGKVVGCFSPISNLNASCAKGLDRVLEEKIITQNTSFLYFSMMVLFLFQSVGETLTFLPELKIVLNEHYNGWYSSGAYYLAKSLLQLPMTIMISVSFSLVGFYGSHQYEETFRILLFVYIFLIGSLCSQGIGFLLGTASLHSEQFAIVYIISVYLVMVALCDYLVPLSRLPDFVRLLTNISYSKHAFLALIIIIYGYDRCPDGQISLAMYQFDLEDDDLWLYSLLMILHLVSIRLLTLALLVWIAMPSTPRTANKTKRYDIKVKPVDSLSIDENDFQINKKKRLSIDGQYNQNGSQQEALLGKQELGLAWINLSFSGKTLSCWGKKSKSILKQLNGRVEFSTLTALMGPSGSGKSTLLKCINGQNKEGLSSDTLFAVNQHRPIRSCFIVQDQKEHLLSGLTGKESLLFASRLKNSGVDNDNRHDEEEESYQVNHKKNVNKLLSDLMIVDTSSTDVKKCSGGEQKRLIIGMELTSFVKPNIICMDEPTSGLDSNTAELVVKTLQEIVKKNSIAIVISIHQPNADVLLMFDKIYVLAKGGKCVFWGAPQDIRKHLHSCDIECADWQVPIEVLLKVASKSNSDEINRMAMKTLEENRVAMESSRNEGMPTSGIEGRNCSFDFADSWYLMWRYLKYGIRSNWLLLVIQFLLLMVLVVCFTLLYDKDIGKYSGCINSIARQNDTCQKTSEQFREEEMIMQNLRYLFFVPVILQLNQVGVTLFTFSSEVKIFFNEHKNGWYSTGSYYLSKTIMELPFTIILNFSFTFVAYYGSGQVDDVVRFLGCLYIYTFSSLITQGMCYAVGVFFTNLNLAIVAAVGCFIVSAFTCGFIAPIDEMHEIVQKLTNLSYLRHLFQGQLALIYGFDRCEPPEISSVMFRFKLDDDQAWISFVWLFVQCLAFRVVAFLLLYVKTNV